MSLQRIEGSDSTTSDSYGLAPVIPLADYRTQPPETSNNPVLFDHPPAYQDKETDGVVDRALSPEGREAMLRSSRRTAEMALGVGAGMLSGITVIGLGVHENWNETGTWIAAAASSVVTGGILAFRRRFRAPE